MGSPDGLLAAERLVVERSIPRFLPFTMSNGRPSPSWVIRLYLLLPFVWPLFGKQFLVVARKA